MVLNKQHSKRRVAVGKSAVLVDRSMMNVKERAVHLAAHGGEEGEEGNRVGDQAFDDMTDLKNEDFIFIY